MATKEGDDMARMAYEAEPQDFGERLVALAHAIHGEVCDCDDKGCTVESDMYAWLEAGDAGEGRTVADLAAEWRDYAQAPEEPNVTVLAAQMIRPWRAPQWLVEPVGDASDQDDLDAIWLAGYGVLSRDVRGWGEYNAIIAVAGTHYLAQLA
jgi:hypothetical protein